MAFKHNNLVACGSLMPSSPEDSLNQKSPSGIEDKRKRTCVRMCAYQLGCNSNFMCISSEYTVVRLAVEYLHDMVLAS